MSTVGKYAPSREEIDAFVDLKPMNRHKARRLLIAQHIHDSIGTAKTVEDLKPILLALLRLTELQT